MNLTERKSETTHDFVAVAEQSAMHKVEDIHLGMFYKHCFVRFGPLVIRNNANSVRDNKEVADQKVDRLEGVLRYGIVAENFAKRIGIPISRNYSDFRNKTIVSLCRPVDPLDAAFSVGIKAAVQLEYIKVPRENIYTVLIKNRYPVYETDESEAKIRIAPRFFMGIVIMDNTDVQWLVEGYGIRINLESATTQETVDKVVEKLQFIYKDKPNLFIPIYGLSGGLYWPRQMSYQEVQKFVGDRRTNGA